MGEEERNDQNSTVEIYIVFLRKRRGGNRTHDGKNKLVLLVLTGWRSETFKSTSAIQGKPTYRHFC